MKIKMPLIKIRKVCETRLSRFLLLFKLFDCVIGSNEFLLIPQQASDCAD
jgi:hypothetical protein